MRECYQHVPREGSVCGIIKCFIIRDATSFIKSPRKDIRTRAKGKLEVKLLP